MEKINKLLQHNMDHMLAAGRLFRTSVSGEDVWQMYLMGFENPKIFRDPTSNEHNCNYCHGFVKRYGNVVALDEDLNVLTLWDGVPEEATSKKEDDLKALAELRFNVAKDVFETRKQEADNATADAAKRREQQKILELIAKKQDAALENLSIEELTKKLEDLKNGK